MDGDDTAPSEADAQSRDLHNRLARWYAAYRGGPALAELLDRLDTVLLEWRHDTPGLLSRMTRTYGPEPPPPHETHLQRAESLLSRHAPQDAPLASEMLASHTGREEEFFARLKLQHQRDATPSPPGSTAASVSEPGSAGVGLLPGCRWRQGDRVCGRFPPVTGPERRGEVVSLNSPSSLNVRWCDGTLTRGVDPLLLEEWSSSPLRPSAAEEAEACLGSVRHREALLARSEEQLQQREEELLAWARHFGVTDAPRPALQASVGMHPGLGAGAEVEREPQEALGARQARQGYRRRLQRFYKKYNPSQLLLVDEMLAAAEGDEEQMFAALVRMHGPEPPAPPVAGPPPPLQYDAYKRRLSRFYEVYNPSQVLMIDQMLAAAEGNEERMFAALVHLHGPEPPPEDVLPKRPVQDDLAKRLKRFYGYYSPSHGLDLDKVARAYQGKGDTLMLALASKYGPEPAFDERLRAKASPVVPAADGGPGLLLLHRERRRLQLGHQMQVLRSLRNGAELEVRFAYYHRWKEHARRERTKGQLQLAASETRAALLHEQYAQQQLESQVAVLRTELELREREASERRRRREVRRAQRGESHRSRQPHAAAGPARPHGTPAAVGSPGGGGVYPHMPPPAEW